MEKATGGLVQQGICKNGLEVIIDRFVCISPQKNFLIFQEFSKFEKREKFFAKFGFH